MDVRQALIALDRFIADADFSLLSQATLLQRCVLRFLNFAQAKLHACMYF